jgi:PHS family inorganic phosphate transporter-like MFS transporter
VIVSSKRRRIKETPRFMLAQMEAREVKQQAERSSVPTGLRGVLADMRMLRWLIGASLAWLLFDFVCYGNTISSPVIVKLVSLHASLTSIRGPATHQAASVRKGPA